MPRHHLMNGELVPFTPAEETDADTIDAKAPSWAKKEEAKIEIQILEGAITPRRMRESVLTADGKAWLDDQEKLIAVERAKL